MLPDDYTKKTPAERLKEPWPPGVSGNPNGRPKGSKNRSTIARMLADMEIEGTELNGKTGMFTAESLYMAALVRKALEGDINAIKELQDTLYGKLTDKSQVEMAATVSKVERTIVDVKE